MKLTKKDIYEAVGLFAGIFLATGFLCLVWSLMS